MAGTSHASSKLSSPELVAFLAPFSSGLKGTNGEALSETGRAQTEHSAGSARVNATADELKEVLNLDDNAVQAGTHAVTWHALITEVLDQLRANTVLAERHPLLLTLCESASELVALRYLPSMLQWQHLIASRYNGRWSLEHARGIRLSVLCGRDDQMRSLAADYVAGWNGIHSYMRDNWSRFRQRSPAMACVTKVNIEEISQNASVIVTLPIDHPDLLLPQLVVLYMVMRHNQLVEFANTDCVADVPCVPLSALAKADGIIFDGPPTLGPVMYRHCTQAAGSTEIRFDYDAIEAELCRTLLSNKPFIVSSDLKKVKQTLFTFNGDVVKTELDQVRESVEQQELNPELAEAVLTSAEVKGNHTALKDLLNLCIRTVAQKGGAPDALLIVYISETVRWNEEHVFLKNVLRGVQLRHLVSLNEQYDKKFRSNRYDQLGDPFRVKLSAEARQELVDVATQMLREAHLSVMQEFVDAVVDMVVSSGTTIGKTSSLKSWLDAVEVEGHDDESSQPWFQAFPATIKLENIFDTTHILREVHRKSLPS